MLASARARNAAEILALGPRLRLRNAAAQTRIVSAARIRLDSRKFVRPFKQIICGDVSEFESHMPSQAVRIVASPPSVKVTSPESTYRIPGTNMVMHSEVALWGKRHSWSIRPNAQTTCALSLIRNRLHRGPLRYAAFPIRWR
jgi:hypothetical protein